MLDVFRFKRGDTAPALIYALTPASTVLTGATVVFKMRPRGGAPVTLAGVTTIVTPTGTPTVQYDWAAGDVLNLGPFEGEFEVTFPSGKIVTFPNSGFIPIRFEEDIR